MSKKPLTNVLRYLQRADTESLSDRQLLARFVEAGDEEAFGHVVRRHGGLVMGVCQRILRHREDAEDAAQATFVVLARRATAISWDESIACWLHEVAVRVALEARGRIARRRGRERNMEAMPEPNCPAETGAKDLAEVLDQELSKLPDKYRAPLVLCYLEGRTRDEAAEQLGWTLSVVKSRLERGRELLRDRLTRRGLTLGAILVTSLLPELATASMSAELVAKTISLVTGKLTVLSVLNLADGVVRGMVVRKLKRAVVFLVAILTASLGIGLAAQGDLSGLAPHENAPPAKAELPQHATLPQEKPVATTLVHGDVVRGGVFSPDGKRLATCSFDGTFRIWDPETGKQIADWRVPGKNSAIAFSRDGRYLAGGNADGEFLVWDVASGNEQAVRLTRQGNVYGIAFSPDGKLLATAHHNGSIGLWKAESGAKVLHLQNAHTKRVWSVAFSPNGKILVSTGEDGLVRLWNPETGAEIRKLTGHQGNVSAVAFSPDGLKLATADMEATLREGPVPRGQADTIRIWEVETGKELLTIRTPLTHAVKFAPDGKRLASGDRIGDIHLWDATTGAPVTQFGGHGDAVIGIDFDRDGQRIVSSSQDGTARIWMLHKSR